MADLIRYLFKFKIRHLFYISLIFASFIAMIIFSVSFFNFYKSHIERKTLDILKLKISLAAELIEKNLNEGELSEVEAVISYLSTINNIEIVILAEHNGKILFSSQRKLIGGNIHNIFKNIPINTLLKEKFSYLFSHNKSKLYVAESIYIKRKNDLRPIRHGNLIISYNFENELKTAYIALIEADIIFILSIIIAGFVLDIIFKKYISRRIQMIVSVLNEVARGNLDTQASIDGNDEIKTIAEQINSMINRLKGYVYYDYLTGVYNRFFFERKVKEKIRKNKKFAMIMFDTDNFKEINDLFGHNIGDKVLQEYALRLENTIKDKGFTGRFGGDEFLVCLDKCCFKNETELKLSVKKILKTLDEPFIIDNYRIDITSTAGISIYPEHANNYKDLLKIADIALYHGKKLGKNVAVVATQEIVNKNIRKAEISAYIKNAIENKELFLVYQPIFSAKDLRIVGIEALLRWKSEKFGIVSPAEFIPVLEETGLIKEVGRWVFKEVLRQAKTWEREGLKDLKINVNVDIQQILEDGFNKFIKEEVLSKNFKNLKLGIEITESEAMQYPEFIINKLKELRVENVIISIDDFGTGNSSLSYLKLMSVDYIKIDKSFIDGIPDDNDSNILVKTVIDLAKSFGYKTVAEGVETHQQVEYLQKIGCDELQGYYFSKPVSPEEIVEIYKISN